MKQFNWIKKGKMFDPTSRYAWMSSHAQVPTILIRDTTYRVFFTTRGKPDISGQFTSRIGYADFDKNDLRDPVAISKEPIVGLGKPGTFDEFGMMPGNIVVEENRLLMYYTGWTRSVTVPFMTSIGVLESVDQGESWHRLDHGPVLGRTLYEPYLENGPFVMKCDNHYHMWYASCNDWVNYHGKYEAIYVTKYAHSVDGLHWVRDGKDCLPSKFENECNGRPSVLEADGVYHMWFCYRHGLDFRQKEGGYRMGYAYSHDLLKWHRDDELAGISLSEEGWDSDMQAYPHVFKEANKLIMLYNGNYFGTSGFGYAQININ